MSLSWTESSLPAKTTVRRAPSGVPKVHAGQRSGAKRCWCSTGATKPPAGDATAATWPSRVLLLVERRGGASRASCAMELIPSDAADTRNRRWRAVGEQQHCSAAAVRARPRRAGGLPARVCRRRERLGWRQSLILGALESSRCVHHSHGHREGACKPKIFRKLATNKGSRELVRGESTC